MFAALHPGDFIGPSEDPWRYRVYRVIHRCLWSEVVLARHVKTRRAVVIKHISPEYQHVYEHEVSVLGQVFHPHIIRLLDQFCVDVGQEKFLCMVLPFCNGRLRHLPDSFCRNWQMMRPVTEALQYCHDRGVVHGDAKHQNVLRHQGKIVLIDFSHSSTRGDVYHPRLYEGKGYCRWNKGSGTLYYSAPEILEDGPWHASAFTDQYSFAVLLSEIFWNYHPFVSPYKGPIPETDDAWLRVRQHGELIDDITGPMREVFVRALAMDPRRRFPNMLALRDAMDAALGYTP